jgi:predicted RNA binding protein YcfA (HicA-like mRNA interferase family)
MKGRQLIRRLKAAGVEIIEKPRQRRSCDCPLSQSPVPTHGNRDIGAGFIRELCKQLGLDPRLVL